MLACLLARTVTVSIIPTLPIAFIILSFISTLGCINQILLDRHRHACSHRRIILSFRSTLSYAPTMVASLFASTCLFILTLKYAPTPHDDHIDTLVNTHMADSISVHIHALVRTATDSIVPTTYSFAPTLARMDTLVGRRIVSHHINHTLGLTDT